MKSLVFLSTVISALIFAADASAWPFPMRWQNYLTTPACAPFEAKDTPDEIDRQWQYRGGEINYIRTKAGTQEVLREVQRYGTISGLNLSVYKYAGETVFKAWACEASEDPATKDRMDHRIAIRKNGAWFSAYAQRPVVWREYDSEGHLTKLTFRLSNRTMYLSDGSIAERVVNIPRAWFIEPQAP